MEAFVTKLQGTGHQLLKESDALLVRTRGAGLAFAQETREAGAMFAHFVRVEAKKWSRYVRIRVAKVEDGARVATQLPELERIVLAKVDGALGTLGARVHGRLTKLAKGKRRGAFATGGARKAKAHANRRRNGAATSSASH